MKNKTRMRRRQSTARPSSNRSHHPTARSERSGRPPKDKWKCDQIDLVKRQIREAYDDGKTPENERREKFFDAVWERVENLPNAPANREAVRRAFYDAWSSNGSRRRALLPILVEPAIYLLDLDEQQQKFLFPESQPSPEGFLSVSEAEHLLFGEDQDSASFAPSLKEYLDGSVHSPSLTGQVLGKLETNHFACVLGKGAAGKTTLAILVALSERFRDSPSFYYDLRQPQEDRTPEQMCEALAVLHGGKALAIVDNIHLEENTTSRIYRWHEKNRAFRLLMIGRETKNNRDRRGLGRPLAAIREQALTLEVESRDLLGVLRRLAARKWTGSPIPEVPPEVLAKWLEVFGGELVAFSTAARKKLHRLRQGNWELSEDDAKDYVREEYSNLMDERERENVLALAACERLELAMPVECVLGSQGFNVGLRHGLVWHIESLRGFFSRYRLFHPGMGRLIIAASETSVTDSTLIYAKLAHHSPFFGFLLADRLETQRQDINATKLVLQSAINEPDAFNRLIEHNLVAVARQCKQLLAHKVLPVSEICARLVASPNLTRSALRTPLHFLANFLGYVQKQPELKPIYQALAKALVVEAGKTEKNRLLEQALATPLADLANFLIYAEAQYYAGDEQRQKEWAVAALLKQSLAKRDDKGALIHLSTLTERALDTSLEHLAHFLEYADEQERAKTWTIASPLKQALAEESNRRILAESARRISFPQLSGFLGYVTTAMPIVGQAVNERLKELFTDLGMNEPRIEELLKFPLNLRAAERVLAGCGLPSMAQEIGCRLITEANQEVWQSMGSYLSSAVTALELGRGAGREPAERFLNRVITSEWLQKSYQASPPWMIVLAILRLWSSAERFICDHFLGEFPLQRVQHWIRYMSKRQELRDIIADFQLLGAGSLFELPLAATTQSWSWPSQSCIRESLQQTLSWVRSERLFSDTISFWLGLRAMAHRRRDGVSVLPDAGDRILHLWQQVESPLPNSQRLNHWMIRWLERCAASGWTLVKDKSLPPSRLEPTSDQSNLELGD